MPVKFDAITPVLSPEQMKHQQQRVADRVLRQKRVSDERRQQLLEVAWRLWHEAGSQGFNMRQMAQRAGYTAGALYAYFPGREAILSALQERVLDEVAVAVRAVKGRVEKGGRRGTDGGALAVTGPVAARSLYVDRSVAWWSMLATDVGALQLVLHGVHAGAMLPDAVSDVPLSLRLSEALSPCLSSLQAMGLPPDAARHLHEEVIAYGLGLLVLLEGVRPGAGAVMESRFLQSVQRWLDIALAATLSDGAAAAAGQGDLFGPG